MQIEHQSVDSAKPGEGVGIKVKDRVRHGDEVYKVTD
jgi:putative protease